MSAARLEALAALALERARELEELATLTGAARFEIGADTMRAAAARLLRDARRTVTP